MFYTAREWQLFMSVSVAVAAIVVEQIRPVYHYQKPAAGQLWDLRNPSGRPLPSPNCLWLNSAPFTNPSAELMQQVRLVQLLVGDLEPPEPTSHAPRSRYCCYSIAFVVLGLCLSPIVFRRYKCHIQRRAHRLARRYAKKKVKEVVFRSSMSFLAEFSQELGRSIVRGLVAAVVGEVANVVVNGIRLL